MKVKVFEIAEEILSIHPKDAGKFFVSKTKPELKEEYRKLCSKWHPDKNIKSGDTSAVFAHLKTLYEYFDKSLDSGFIVFANNILVDDESGKRLDVGFKKKMDIDIGEVYIGNSVISYRIAQDYNDLYRSAIKHISSFKFANKKMEDEMMKYVPKITKVISKDVNFLILEKSKDTVLLKDLLAHCNGAIDSKHVAWILSSMYNLACFFQYNKMMYGGFSIDEYLVNPETHLGFAPSFWYSAKSGEKISALSSKAVSVAPQSVLNTKKANISLDLEMIRLVGRELLGDKTGIKLAKNKAIPKAMVEWLRGSTTGDAVKDYKVWHEEVLKGSFGVRRFTEMGIKFNDVYN